MDESGKLPDRIKWIKSNRANWIEQIELIKSRSTVNWVNRSSICWANWRNIPNKWINERVARYPRSLNRLSFDGRISARLPCHKRAWVRVLATENFLFIYLRIFAIFLFFPVATMGSGWYVLCHQLWVQRAKPMQGVGSQLTHNHKIQEISFARQYVGGQIRNGDGTKEEPPVVMTEIKRTIMETRSLQVHNKSYRKIAETYQCKKNLPM